MEEEYMKIALNEAKKAFKKGEVPIGAIIVKNGKVIARAHNKRERSKIATHHAEILAINKACKKFGDWRLEDCQIYVTLEPCPMCAGAIVNSRIDKCFYGASDKNSNKELAKQIFSDVRLNHKTQYEGGILEEECAKLLTDFFKLKR